MKKRTLCLAIACCALFTMVATASTITVTNFSFETLPVGGLPNSCGAGCTYSNAPIPGWTTAPIGALGQMQPGSSTTLFNFVPDGITVAYTNNGSISQTTGATVALGVIYTLTVDVGFRNDVIDPGSVDLLIGSTRIAATGVPAQKSGNWSTYTATYTGLVTDLGKQVGIRLSSPGVQGNWDNVLLSDSTNGP